MCPFLKSLGNPLLRMCTILFTRAEVYRSDKLRIKQSHILPRFSMAILHKIEFTTTRPACFFVSWIAFSWMQSPLFCRFYKSMDGFFWYSVFTLHTSSYSFPALACIHCHCIAIVILTWTLCAISYYPAASIHISLTSTMWTQPTYSPFFLSFENSLMFHILIIYYVAGL